MKSSRFIGSVVASRFAAEAELEFESALVVDGWSDRRNCAMPLGAGLGDLGRCDEL